jgi:hypothetical protein
MQNGGECLLAFDTCQGRTKTEMGSISKRQMAVILAANVEAVRIGEALWIPVRSPHYGHYGLLLADQLAA